MARWLIRYCGANDLDEAIPRKYPFKQRVFLWTEAAEGYEIELTYVFFAKPRTPPHGSHNFQCPLREREPDHSCLG